MSEPTRGRDAAFETQRFEVRALRAEDEALYCTLFCDAGTMHFIGPAWTHERALRAFRSALRATRSAWPADLFLTVIERATRETIGICTLQRVDLAREHAELGLMLLPGARDHGYAREILRALAAFAFAALPIAEMRAAIAASHSVAERLLVDLGYARVNDGHSGTADVERCIWSVRREAHAADQT